jgi:cell division septation protein DedD
MNKYLLQILHDINTIIIPGLGALTVTNSKTGEIMFMGFLKHDDGNLAKYISEKEGISENDAKNLIAKYVREINIQLDKGESYDMYQFGRFSKIDGEINFENWNKYNTTDATSENVIIEKVEDQQTVEATNSVEEIATEIEKAEEKIEAKEEPEVQDEQVIEKVISIDEILSSHEPTEPSVENIEKAEDAPIEIENEEVFEIVEAKIEEVIAPIEQENKIEEKIDAHSEKAKTKPIKADIKPEKNTAKKETEKKKRGVGFWILMFLILILVGGGITAGIFIDEIKKAFSSTKIEHEINIENDTSSDVILEKIEDQVSLKEENSETNETTENTEIQETEVKEVKSEKQSYVGLGFHIIAGGFSSEENANNLAKKYQAEGKNSSVLGKFDELYLVAYESFSSKEEAQSALKSSAIKGWVFKYEK